MENNDSNEIVFNAIRAVENLAKENNTSNTGALAIIATLLNYHKNIFESDINTTMDTQYYQRNSDISAEFSKQLERTKLETEAMFRKKGIEPLK